MPAYIVGPVTFVCVAVVVSIIAVTIINVKKKREKKNGEAQSRNASVPRTAHTHDNAAFSQDNQQSVIPTAPLSTEITQRQVLPRRLPPLDHNRGVDRGSINATGMAPVPPNASQPPLAEDYGLVPPPSYDEAVL